jgi:hypothetical protein
MSITESCHFKVSYDPSEYLAGVALQSAETHLGESLHLPIKYIALCQVPIKYITTAFCACHEFLVVSVGHKDKNNYRKEARFTTDIVEYNKSDFIIIEFSKQRTDDSEDCKLGVLNLTWFSIDKQASRNLAWARYSKVDGGVDSRCNVLSIVKSRQGWLLVMFSTWQGR